MATYNGLSVGSGNPIETTFSSKESLPVDVGAVFAGGVRFHRGRIGLAPEFRYERWGSGAGTFQRKNQASFMFGIPF